MDESSEELENKALSAFQSQRMSKTGIYWSEIRLYGLEQDPVIY